MAFEELDPAFVDAVIGQESSGNPNAVSPKGAEGLMQVMPATAAEIAQELGYDSYDMKDPETNLVFGKHYLSKQIEKFGSPSLGLAAYNAGPGRVQEALNRAQELGRPQDFESIRDLLPQETQDYVPKIMSRYEGSPSPETSVTQSSVRIDPASVGLETDMEDDWEDTLQRAQQIQMQRQVERSRYPEDMSATDMSGIINDGRPVAATIGSLHNKTPQQRAEIGGVMGASTGLAVGGLAGSLIGAGVGAIAARSAGIVQSEDYQLQTQNTEFVNTLGMIGLVDKNGKITIDTPDGQSKSLLNVNAEIPNASPIYGEPFRTVFDKDDTNPFTARAETISIPIAMMLAAMSQTNVKGSVGAKYAKNVTNFFTNSLVSNARSMEEVYANARGIAEKLGIKKDDLKSFLKQNKNSFNKNKYQQHMTVIDTLYAR